MKHINCGGEVKLEGDTYRCQKCKSGWKCVGNEHYLRGIVEWAVLPTGQDAGLLSPE